jgi:UDP-glucose 4-epimerase
MSVLVTGGAGYIGAHVVRLLRERPENVVVVDDLSTGRAERVSGTPVVRIDLAADAAVDELASTLDQHAVTSVIHIAAKKQVGESAARPAWYYAQNVGGMAHLLQAMERAGADRLMFSSSAATYGLPDLAPGALLGEDTPPAPISPYGETKLVCEWMIAAAARAWGLRAVDLRYFNVAGAGWDDLGDPGVFNLIPIVLRALTAGEQPRVFGADYPTPDGTCVRDYVHVLDLADAHLAALDYLELDQRPYDLFNVGTGVGASVREVLDEVGRATGYDLAPQVVERRPGDPATLVADPARIAGVLGWRSSRALPEIVASAWSAWPHTPQSSAFSSSSS